MTFVEVLLAEMVEFVWAGSLVEAVPVEMALVEMVAFVWERLGEYLTMVNRYLMMANMC